MMFAILLSGDIQANAEPISNLCDSCGNRVKKMYNVRTHKKCNSMRIFEKGLCNKCKTSIVNRDFSELSKSLPFHQVMNTETNHTITLYIKIFNKHFQKTIQH